MSDGDESPLSGELPGLVTAPPAGGSAVRTAPARCVQRVPSWAGPFLVLTGYRGFSGVICYAHHVSAFLSGRAL